MPSTTIRPWSCFSSWLTVRSQGGLAGPGRSDDDDDLAFLHGEVDVSERGEISEPLDDPLQADDLVGCLVFHLLPPLAHAQSLLRGPTEP